MAENNNGPIQKSDVITEEAITAPLELAKNMDTADKQVNKFIADAKKMSTSITKPTGINDLQKALKQLAEQEKQIIELQKQLNEKLKDPAPTKQKNAMQQLKEELKAARAEMVKVAMTLGEDSKEFVEATKRAGELQDQLNGIAEAAKDASGGSGFERLTSQTARFRSQITTGDFKGATASLNQMAATTKALTFKESTDGAKQFISALASMGKAIFTNPIFLLAAAITLIVVAVVKLKDSVKLLDDVFQAVGDAITWVLDQGKKFLDWLGLSSFALEKRTDQIIKNSEKERAAIERRYNAEIALAKAAGQETNKLEAEKQMAIIKSLSIAIFAIDQEKKANKTLTKARKEELDKQRLDLFQALEDASIALQIANLEEIEDVKKKNKALRDAAYELQKYRLEVAIANNDAITKDTYESEAKRVKASRDNIKLREQLAELTRKHELDQEKLLADEKKLINEKAANDKTKATKMNVDEENKIWEDEDKKRRERNAAELEEFKKKFFDRIRIMKQAIADEAELWQRGLDLEIRAIKENVVNGTMTRRQGEEAITKLVKEQNIQRTQVEIDAIKKTLEQVDLSQAERKELAQKLYEFELQLLDAQYEATEDKLPKVIAAIQQAYGALSSSLTQLFDNLTQNRIDALDREQEHNDEVTKAALQAAGDNEKLKEQINRDAEAKQKQLDARRKEEQRKQAVYQKQLALVQAAIALSQAIVEALTAGPGIGQALAIATAAAGAIQIAAIAARQIPSYAKGVKNAPGGKSRVSEEGPELMVTKDGMYLTPAKESFIDVPKGADIYPHKQTMRMLAEAGLNDFGGHQHRQQDGTTLLAKKLDGLEMAIRGQKFNQWNVSSRGVERILRQGDTRIKFLKSTYK